MSRSSSNSGTSRRAPLQLLPVWTTLGLIALVLGVGFWGESRPSLASASLGLEQAPASPSGPLLAVQPLSSPGGDARSMPLTARQIERLGAGRRGGVVEGRAPVQHTPGDAGHPGGARAETWDGLGPDAPAESIADVQRLLHPGGELAAQGRREGDARVGRWSFWYADGSLRATKVYAAGQLEGPLRSWHPGGGLAESGAYEGGLRHGPWLRLYTGGAVKESGTYAYGLRVGQWEFFDSKGRLDPRSGWYDQGLRVE